MPAVLRARGGAGNTSFALTGTPHIGLAPMAYRPYTTFTPDMIMQKTAAPVARIAAAIASSTAASLADALRPSSRAIICSTSCVYCAGACAALPHGPCAWPCAPVHPFPIPAPAKRSRFRGLIFKLEMPTAAGPGVSQFGRTPKGRRASVASQASCESIGLKEEANATAAKENVSSQAADRPAASDRALSPAPAPDGSSLQTQRGPNNHRDDPAKQIVATSEAQCEETGSGVQREDRPALVQEERKEGGGECEENDDRGALLRQKEALEDEVVYLRQSFAEVCSLLGTLQTDRAAEGKGAKSAEGPVGGDDALRTRHLSPRKRCRRQQIEDVFTADGYSDAVPTAPHPSPPSGLESPSPLKTSTANRSGTPSQSLYTCRGSEFSGPSPPSGFGSAGREGPGSIPFSPDAPPSTSTPASSINRWISSLILTPSGFSFSGQPAPGHARGTAAAGVEEGGDVAQRISFFGDKDSSIPRRPRGVASPPDRVPSEAGLFQEDSAGQDLLARAKALIQDTSKNTLLPEDQESLASVPGPHTPSRHGRKLLACREAGAADKTSHEIAMEELERAMAEKEAACERKLVCTLHHVCPDVALPNAASIAMHVSEGVSKLTELRVPYL